MSILEKSFFECGMIRLNACYRKTGRVSTCSRRRRQEMSIARRLFLVALTDFLCWFPVGVMGLMAEFGVDIDLKVSYLKFRYGLNSFDNTNLNPACTET